VPRSETSSSDSSPRFAYSSSPSASCDDDRVVHHLLAARSAFRHSNGNDERDSDSATLMNYDARARPTELETLSRAGAVARFALRRFDPPGEPRRSTSPSGACLAACCLPLRVVRVSGARRLSLSLRAHTAPARMPCAGEIPDCATSSTEPTTSFTTRRLSTTRRAIMASDVSRGLRAAACRQHEGPVRAHSSREWNTAESPPRERPRTPSVIGPGA
jgi:hypothetical protein